MNEKASKLKRLNNGLPQGSVLAPTLFCLYIGDLPTTRSKLFLYADDLAVLFQSVTFPDAEKLLEEDLKILFDYYVLRRLKPNPSKTVVTVYHLNNKEADRSSLVKVNGVALVHDKCPKYIGLHLDRTSSYNKHLEKTSLKIRTRNNLIHKLCLTNWSASADVLRTSTISLIVSVADFGSPVWLNSKHISLVDVQVNENLRKVSGTLKSTP